MPVPFGSENEKPPSKPQPIDPSKFFDHMSLSRCKRREMIAGATEAAELHS